MPAVLLLRVFSPYGSLYVKIPKLIVEHYKYIFKDVGYSNKSHVKVFIDRVYSDQWISVKEYKAIYTCNLRSEYENNAYIFVIDIDHLKSDGLPQGYSLLLTLFSVTTPKGETFPVFPNEFRIFVDEDLKVPQHVMVEIESLSRLQEGLDVVVYLHDVGFQRIAVDLMEGLRRFNAGDYEGAIKFFRKVVEGWRNLLQQQDFSIPVGEKRREALRDYASKAFHLLSNFGEHAGTHGSYKEALLSKNMAMELSRYLASYLLEGQTHKQSKKQRLPGSKRAIGSLNN